MTIRQIAEEIGYQLGVAPVFKQVEVGDDIIADPSRTNALLGQVSTDFHTGISKLLAK